MTIEFELELIHSGEVLTFEWDANKCVANQMKHGISFEEAAHIFQNVVLTNDDPFAEGEVRELSFGRLGADNSSSVVVCVVHTERNGNIRIISARKATTQERKSFDVHIQKTYH